MKDAEARSSPLEETQRWLQRMKNLSLFAVYMVMAFRGAAEATDLSVSYAGLVALTMLLFQSSIASWATWDARSRGMPLLRIQQEATFCLAPFAILIYLIATRRWRGAGLWTLHAVGCITVFALSQWLLAMLIYALQPEFF